MGVFTIVASIPGKYPGFGYADKIEYVDTTDYMKILQIAKKEKINGICTTGTDVAIFSIGKVCSELGLNGLSESAAKIACNKKLMKQKFAENGVNTAVFHTVSTGINYYDAKDICEKIGYPVIFKAVDSSGSRGIVKVNKEDEIQRAKNSVLNVTHDTHFIIEKFLEGEEFGAQSFVQNGKLEFVVPHGDYVFKGDTGVPIGHFAPYSVQEIDAKVEEQLKKAINVIGLNNCAINADFMLCNEKVYVLEIGARAGATCLAELVSIYYGYDYYEKIIRVALGETVDFTPQNTQRQPNASMLLMSDKDGIIKSIENKNIPDENIYEILFDFNIGDSVRKFRVGPDRIGHVITKGEIINDAVETLHKALDNITIEVD
jgi:biotin carboxylase